MSAVDNELRSAAALIRERADVNTGRWVAIRQGDEYLRRGDVATDGVPGERDVICEHAGPDADHIASWHPIVALAFADLLDDLADVDTVRCPSLVQASALKAARAYLD